MVCIVDEENIACERVEEGGRGGNGFCIEGMPNFVFIFVWNCFSFLWFILNIRDSFELVKDQIILQISLN